MNYEADTLAYLILNNYIYIEFLALNKILWQLKADA